MERYISVFYSGKEWVVPDDMTAAEFVGVLKHKGELNRAHAYRITGYQQVDLKATDHIYGYRDLAAIRLPGYSAEGEETA